MPIVFPMQMEGVALVEAEAAETIAESSRRLAGAVVEAEGWAAKEAACEEGCWQAATWSRAAIMISTVSMFAFPLRTQGRFLLGISIYKHMLISMREFSDPSATLGIWKLEIRLQHWKPGNQKRQNKNHICALAIRLQPGSLAPIKHPGW